MSEPVRLQKAIAHSGLMSRRAAEEKIAAGRVQIDSRTAVLGDRVDVSSEIVRVDGKILPVNPESLTVLLYKPVGVISTAEDPQKRTTVVDLIDSDLRLYPVGRLDADSEGLILLTNDGLLADRVTHPRYGIHKKYLVEVQGNVARPSIRRLVSGIDLDDGPANAISARVVDSNGGRTHIEILMGEGRKRQVRRMLESIGYPVTRLVRTAIGPITDTQLKPGEHRQLSNQEIARLLAEAVGE